MPVGMTDLRGIPPDKRVPMPSYGGNQLQKHLCFERCTLNLECNPLITNKTLHCFELSNGTVVLTNYPTLHELHSNLSQQLNHHGQCTNLAKQELNDSSTFENIAMCKTLHNGTKLTTTIINTESNPQDITTHKTPPLSPINISRNNTITEVLKNAEITPLHIINGNIKIQKPLKQKQTGKKSVLTTRLLYPKTRLPYHLPSLMTIFKNRIHRLNAYR